MGVSVVGRLVPTAVFYPSYTLLCAPLISCMIFIEFFENVLAVAAVSVVTVGVATVGVETVGVATVGVATVAGTPRILMLLT
jgi:glutamate mutase epsilon subunit